MDVTIREESLSYLEEYARIPIAFEVETIFEVRVRHAGLGGIDLVEIPAPPHTVKDYDTVDEDVPTNWLRRGDLSAWGFLSAHLADRCVGGTAVAFRTPGLLMLEGRDDLAVLWDLRVRPGARGRGVGRALFAAAEDWARGRGCRRLKVETQNINVPACRFYAAQGCTLGGLNRFAYPDLPHEVQLLWYKEL